MRGVDVDLALAVAAHEVRAPSPLKSAPPVMRCRPTTTRHCGAGAERAGARAGVGEEATLDVAGVEVHRAVAVLVADADELGVAAHALGEHRAVEPPFGVPSRATMRPLWRATRSLRPSWSRSPTAVMRVVLGGLDDLGRRLELAVALPGRMRSTPCSLVETRSHAVAGQVGDSSTSGRLAEPLADDDGGLAEGGQAAVGGSCRARHWRDARRGRGSPRRRGWTAEQDRRSRAAAAGVRQQEPQRPRVRGSRGSGRRGSDRGTPSCRRRGGR